MNTELLHKINYLKQDNNIIITWCNRNYINRLHTLINSLKNCKIDNYLIMAMDKETFNIDSHHSYLTSCFKNKSDLWVKRVKVLNNVIDNNINCLHVDVDIIINQNPFNYFKMLLLE